MALLEAIIDSEAWRETETFWLHFIQNAQHPVSQKWRSVSVSWKILIIPPPPPLLLPTVIIMMMILITVDIQIQLKQPSEHKVVTGNVFATEISMYHYPQSKRLLQNEAFFDTGWVWHVAISHKTRSSSRSVLCNREQQARGLHTCNWTRTGATNSCCSQTHAS